MEEVRTIDRAIELLNHLKEELLFNSDEMDVLPPLSEQFALLGLANIEQARANLQLAKYHQMQKS